MAQMIWQKTLNMFLTWLSHGGTTFVVFNQITKGKLNDLIEFSDFQMNILIWSLICFYIAKLAWFVYSKFYLERRERLSKVRKCEDDLKQVE